jgi:hypothetical protein
MIHKLFTQLVQAVALAYTPDNLARYFSLPSIYFVQHGDRDGPIVFHQAGAAVSRAIEMSGAIFWPKSRQIVRGLPRILPSSDHTREAAAAHYDRAFIDCLKNHEAVIETKEPGQAVRLYCQNGSYYFATRATHDGREPLTGAGIDNAKTLGVTLASQARRICDADCPGAYKLASLGYTLIFALLLPERESFIPADRPALVFIDAVDPDFEFVDRLEKERIAEDYALPIVASHGRIASISADSAYFGRLRALELTAAQNGDSGYVVKIKRQDDGAYFAVRAEPPGSYSWRQAFSESDMQGVYDTILEDFKAPIQPAEFLEELMLEYLGSSRRSTRWQVADWIRKM